MPTSFPEPFPVQAAYVTIADFFDAQAMEDSRRDIKRIAMAIALLKPWRDNPSNILYFFEKLEGLVEAALTIYGHWQKREAAVLSLPAGEVPSIAAYAEYCGWHKLQQPWRYFPRSLSVKDYANPYRVFARVAAFGTLEEWRAVLKSALYAVLNTQHSYEEDLELNALELYLLLTRLVEAAHLVEVRAIMEVNGEPLRKWRGPAPEADPSTIAL